MTPSEQERIDVISKALAHMLRRQEELESRIRFLESTSGFKAPAPARSPFPAEATHPHTPPPLPTPVVVQRAEQGAEHPAPPPLPPTVPPSIGELIPVGVPPVAETPELETQVG